ncbi:MAG: hypothetical protein K2Q22_13525, partial [Cytophagales bacterium]|nr:hypothetical protein [Cytophagales bacterium]
MEKAGFEVLEIIPNGGKWSLLGQVLYQTLPAWILKPRLIRRSINFYCLKWDMKNQDFSNTMNYVVVCKKRVD